MKDSYDFSNGKRGAVFIKTKILDLDQHQDLIPMLADWHKSEWPHLERDRIEMIKGRTSAESLPKTFIATTNSPVGLASLIEKDDERTPWLSCLLVAPEARGKGIGKTLLDHCIKYASSLGYKKLFLHTTEAADYYHKLGWIKIDQIEQRAVFVKNLD